MFKAVGESWASAAEIAHRTSMLRRTVNHHLLFLLRQGVVERVETFPEYRYRRAEAASGKPYADVLARAAEAIDG